MIDQKSKIFLISDLKSVGEVCIMATRYGEVAEWLKVLPC